MVLRVRGETKYQMCSSDEAPFQRDKVQTGKFQYEAGSDFTRSGS